MDRRTVLLGSFGFAFPSTFVSQSTGKSYALLVGVESYDSPDISLLNFAVKDVVAVSSVFSERLRFSKIRLMTSDSRDKLLKPTNTNVLAALDLFQDEVGPNDTFVFYFSGHGFSRGGSNFLATQNTDPRSIESLKLSSLPLEMLQSKFSKIKCRQKILIIDACRNDPEKGKGDSDNVLRRDFAKDLTTVAKDSVESGGGVALVFACSEGERAWESEDYGQSVFTHYFLEGLTGTGNSLRVDDVVGYTAEKVSNWARERGKRQTPDLRQEGVLKLAFGSNGPTVVSPKPVEPKVEVAPTAIRLELLGLPAGAKVLIDNVVLSGTVYADEIAEKTKDLEVSVSASSFRPYVRRVTLTRGSASTLRVTMEPTVPNSSVKMKPTVPIVSHGTAKPITKSYQNTYPALDNYLRSLRTVRSGKFQMGSSSGPADERPIHDVTLTTIRMGATPVTVAVWREYCNANGLQLPAAPRWGWFEDHPIVNVSWDDIMGTAGNLGFCSWVSNVAGLVVKLPTEAQFEFALRGGHDNQTFPWGQLFESSKVWCSSKQTRKSTAPVNRGNNFFTNRFGLTDLTGNVSEWCFDAYMPYNRAPLNNPAVHFGYSVDRCFRGGSWKESASTAFRCSRRMFSYQGNKSDEIGFRLVAL